MLKEKKDFRRGMRARTEKTVLVENANWTRPTGKVVNPCLPIDMN